MDPNKVLDADYILVSRMFDDVTKRNPKKEEIGDVVEKYRGDMIDIFRKLGSNNATGDFRKLKNAKPGKFFDKVAYLQKALEKRLGKAPSLASLRIPLGGGGGGGM